ncbi:hypothetical protein HIM_00889 [Hirsutella minnesotensis 3608]|nr:hypothetical protein HIM_00889 [Hirsutella minnesotensis 3608]
MATEPSIEKLADVSASSESQPAAQSHDAVLDPPILNGIPPATNDDVANKRITNVEDQINSADVSVSGGSDTEARQKDGDKSHGRTSSSAKKPAMFKAVSVNKTFLASKASPSSTSSKVSDKPLAGASTPPPGSTALSASRPRLVAKTGTGGRDSAPRFSSVANGGKPATAPDPNVVWNKNRPPEPKKFTDEELKKYGIHMASRLNEEDAQGQNKWADIDDDDDDWAPEAITWGDGTKTTLPHPDEQTTTASENGDSASITSKSQTQAKPKSPAPPAPTGSPLPRSTNLASGKGLILKSASQEKPALVAKPPAPPAPMKSPWATLPPVDRASPASAEASLASRQPSKDTIKNVVTQPKEIAADDFSRSSWREGPSHASRELFNSHSGRYEPVSERRGSIRSEVQPKQPALLHRPQPSDQPAEPSSAFQTSRTSQDALGRRRGSSNVSGSSGTYLQRLGKANDAPMQSPPEILGTQRASLTGSAEGPISPGPVNATTQAPSKPQAAQAWIPKSSSGIPPNAPNGGAVATEMKAGPPPSTEPIVDEVEYQKKLMRERIELARKRRQEEEAREEAAKKERIQKKLEALGPPPDKKADKKDAVSKDEVPKPTQIKQRKSPELAQPSAPISKQEAPADSTKTDAALHDAEGPTTIKVAITEVLSPGPSARRLSQSQDGKRSDPWGGPGPRPERFSSWAAGVPPPSRNVWGSPDNDRGLGNGTFNPDLGRIPGSTVAVPQGHKGPAPIAPPNSARMAQGQAQAQNPIAPQSSRYGAPGSDLASKWVAAVADGDKKLSAAQTAEKTGRERRLAERGLTAEDVQPVIKDTWRPVHLPGDGTRRAISTVEVQSHAAGPWKASQEKLGKSTAPVEESSPASSAGIIGSGSNSILPQPSSGAPSQLRSSRFFPVKDCRHDTGSGNAEPSRPASPSLPPPTMEGHPAYEGDVVHPHVSLPKPQPVVKLPPSMMTSQPPQARAPGAWTSRLSFREALRGPANQGVNSEEPSPRTWQDKINSLLSGGKPLPQKHVGADPAGRNAPGSVGHQEWAAGTLPSVASGCLSGNTKSPFSKPMAEECFEEQEMGSLPQIRLPHRAPEAAWQPAVAQTKPLPRRFSVQPSTVEPFYFAADIVGGGNVMKVMLEGMTEAKLLTVPFSVARLGRGGQGRPPARHRGLGHGSRGGKKESSNNFGGKDMSSSNPSRSSRGTYRRRGSDSWSRQPSQASAQSKAQGSPSA